MQITLNGKPESLEREQTVTDLLRRLEIDSVRVAVEINEDIVSRRVFDATKIQDGDRVEIVTFVGGG